MRKIALTLLLAAFVFAARADAGQYTVNDQAIENVLHAAVNVSSLSMGALHNAGFLSDGTADATTSVADANGGKNFAVALILNVFVGELGLHRLYLGTKTMTWVGYILTCGGIFGIVPLVDLIVLIIHNQDISPYVDNPHFFMWAGGNM